MPDGNANHLWGTYASHMIASDELNGGGINWWTDVMEYAEGGEVYVPLITNSEDLWANVDTMIGAENRNITVPHEPREYRVR